MNAAPDKHRNRIAIVGAKFLLLALFSTGIYFLQDIALLLLALALTIVAHLLSGVSIRRMLAPLRMLLLIFVMIGIALFVFQGLQAAIVTILRMTILVLGAHLVTETTTTGEMIDSFVAGLTPFEKFGVNAEKVGLSLALTIRFIPLLGKMAGDVSEAQKARGIERSFLAFAVPLIVRTLKMADEISEALDARGFGSRDVKTTAERGSRDTKAE